MLTVCLIIALELHPTAALVPHRHVEVLAALWQFMWHLTLNQWPNAVRQQNNVTEVLMLHQRTMPDVCFRWLIHE